jgi:hypothetical protein
VIRREHRIEILVVSVIVLLGAFYARAEYIPPWADRNLEIAEEKWDLPVSDVGSWFSAWTLGDGQAFAVIASDPLGLSFGDDLREPGYRFQRAGYSWLAWAASGGQPGLVPYALALVGALAVIGTLILAISLRARVGPSAWFLVLNPALYIGFAGDTAEPVAILFLGLALATDAIWAAIALGVTRPDFLLSMIGRWRPLFAGIAAAVVIAIYSVWHFGLDTMLPKVDLLAVPLSGYIEHSTAAGWVLAVAASSTLVVGARYRNWAWVAVGTYVISFAPVVTADPVNAWRAAGLMPVLWAFGAGVTPSQEAGSMADEEFPAAV